MKRLLAQIGLTYFTVLAVVFCADKRFTVTAAGVCLLCTVVFFFIRKIRKTVYLPVMAITALVACLVNLGYGMLAVEPIVEEFTGSKQQIAAILTDEGTAKQTSCCYPLRVTQVNGEETDFRLLLYTRRSLDAEPFDTLRFTADLAPTVSGSDIAKGFFLRTDEEGAITVVTADSRPLYYTAIQIRRYFRSLLEQQMPHIHASLCQAVLLGDRYAMHDDLKEDFRTSGALYFVVVSGMHFAILISLLSLLLTRTRLPRAAQALISVVFVVVFMAVTGFAPSVIRSGIMMLVYQGSRVLRRVSYPFNSLGLACILMTVISSPYCAGDIGLVLSVYATFGILMWSDKIYAMLSIKPKAAIPPAPGSKRKVQIYFSIKIITKWINGFLMLLSASLAANILVVPISIFAFRAVSLITLASSVVLYIWIYLFLVLGLIFFLLSLIPFMWGIAALFSSLLYYVSAVVLFSVGVLSEIPYAYVYIRSPFVYGWIAVVGVLILSAVYIRAIRRRLRYILPASAIVLLCGVIVIFGVHSGDIILHAFHTNSGEFVALDYGFDTYLVAMDASYAASYKAIARLSQPPRLRAAVAGSAREGQILTHLRSDGFAISDIIVYDKNDTAYESARYLPIAEDTTVDMANGLRLRLVPDGERILRCLITEAGSILIVPDGYAADRIPQDLRAPDILVLSMTPANAEELSCDTLIFCGKENFRTRGLLQQISSEILYTDADVDLRLR